MLQRILGDVLEYEWATYWFACELWLAQPFCSPLRAGSPPKKLRRDHDTLPALLELVVYTHHSFLDLCSCPKKISGGAGTAAEAWLAPNVSGQALPLSSFLPLLLVAGTSAPHR